MHWIEVPVFQKKPVDKKSRKQHTPSSKILHLSPAKQFVKPMRLNSSFSLIIAGLLLLLSHSSAPAQQQQYFDNPDMLYREALEQFSLMQYGAARQSFRQLMDELPDKNDIRYVDAAYYDAVCAIELDLADANTIVHAFAENYRSSRWKNRIDFLQARVLFSDRKYGDALEILEKLDPASLAPIEKNEYYFKRGFSRLRQDETGKALQDFSRAKNAESAFREASIYYYAHIQYLNEEYEDALQHFKMIENTRPYNRSIPIYIMQISYHKGDYEQITQIGESVYGAADNRRKPELARILADALYKQNRYEEALQYYLIFQRSARVQLSREDNYQIGISQFKTENFQDAISGFQKAIGADDSLSQNAHYYLAASYLETGQKNFARNAFLSAYKINLIEAITEDALFNYARLSIEAGPDPFNQAIEALQAYIENNPYSERRNEAYGYIVQLYLSSRNYNAALDFLEKEASHRSELQDVYAELAYSRAVELYHAKRYPQSITYFTRAANQRQKPEIAAKATFWMAEAYYQQRNYEAARRTFRQFLSLPSANRLDIYPLASYHIGYTFFQEKNYQAAIPSFRQFVARPYQNKPELVHDANLRLADCHFVSKDYQRAIAAYDLVINSRHTEVDYALFQKAQAYGALGNFDRKIHTLNQLVRNFPRSGHYDNALYEMASTNLVMNDNRGAINAFDRLVRERPRSPFAKEALVKTGLIYYNNNQHDRAINVLKKVVKDYPTTAEAREALNTLRVIYMEMNDLQSYFAYTEELGFVQVSISEQDSLAFTMAENFYQEGRCSEALQALNTYINAHPQGAFLLQAHYYSARCQLRGNRYDAALTHLEFIINFTDNQYTDEALLEAARILYDKDDFEQAHIYYARLLDITNNPLQQLESLEGKMKSSYFLEQYQDAIAQARQLENHERVGQEQRLQAYYILGKSQFALNRLPEAREAFQSVHQQSRGVLGAEAFYLLAEISYELGYYDDAENQLFELADTYAAYDFWVAKGFILLADIYVKQDNVFQAKQTLQSIVDNYRGQDLRNEAARKLAAISE